MAPLNITSIVNNSAAARRRREEVLQCLELPYDGEYVCGYVPREYLRLMAEAEATPQGAAQTALCLHDEARRAGLVVDVDVDEYNSPAQYIIRAGSLPALMIQSCGHGRSYILDGSSGALIKDMSYGAWEEIFEEVAAASKK